jgi:hypothetical protein
MQRIEAKFPSLPSDHEMPVIETPVSDLPLDETVGSR